MHMFVPGLNFYERVMRVLGHTTPPMTGGLNSPKSGTRGDGPNIVVCVTRCYGGMKLRIPNPGVSGNDESAAPLYECFCPLDVHQCNENGCEDQPNCRVVIRKITVVDIADRRSCV